MGQRLAPNTAAKQANSWIFPSTVKKNEVRTHFAMFFYLLFHQDVKKRCLSDPFSRQYRRALLSADESPMGAAVPAQGWNPPLAALSSCSATALASWASSTARDVPQSRPAGHNDSVSGAPGTATPAEQPLRLQHLICQAFGVKVSVEFKPPREIPQLYFLLSVVVFQGLHSISKQPFLRLMPRCEVCF